MARFAALRRLNLARFARILVAIVALVLIVLVVLGFVWNRPPSEFDVEAHARTLAKDMEREPVTGFATAATLLALAETLLDKPGGYLTNDVMPPGVWLDNMPSWEFGVLVQIRDTARAMRNDFSRSQSQSAEDPDLAQAEGKFFFDNSSWVFPASEAEYREGIRLLRDYLLRLSDPRSPEAQFYARADNLRAWLAGVSTRLGSLSQRLAASVGKQQINLGLAGDPAARQATAGREDDIVRTPWTELDNVFFEARGQTWALIHLLRAVEIDFAPVLAQKNARISVRQIIQELEPTQQQIWSPVILNGGGFGILANHSLVMGSYIARANAAIIDLRNLLAEG